MATVTVFECTSGATVVSGVPQCADGGTWKTITYVESIPEEFNTELAGWAAGAVLLMWVVGLTIGVIVGIVRKVR